MKKLLGIVVLGFFLIFPSQADDIRDFQIEGMTIGDSLLDYMSENKINNSKRNYLKNKKYYVVYTTDSLETYVSVDIYLKTGDKSYKIRTLVGVLHPGKKNECLSKKKEIENELDKIFLNSKKKTEDDVSHLFDKTGKSKQYQTGYFLGKDMNDDHIRVECSFFTKKMKKKHKFTDTLNVVAMTAEISNWIAAGYK
mgnify:CR=1 FL=1